MMTPEDVSYLRGEKFSNNYYFKTIRNFPGQSRLDILRNECRGKRVIHLGAADHKGLIADKITAGIWLHGVITDVAKECVGVDIEKDVVEWVTKEHRVSNMIAGNIFATETVGSFRERGPWDQILLGEILEHIPNPVEFLSDLKKSYSGIVSELLITVPNAFRISNFLNCLKHFEANNTDHKYWFTPYTLASVAVSSGLSPGWIAPCHYVWEMPRRFIFHRHMQRTFPLLRDCLVLKCKV